MTTAATGNVTINYALAAGTATSGVDYTYTGGVLTITAGSRTGTVSVNTIEDTVYE